MTSHVLHLTRPLWSRLRALLSSPMQATGGLEHRVHDLELQVATLQQQALDLTLHLSSLQTRVNTWGAPMAVLPTDVYLAGRRYTETGEAYWTTSNGPGDRWIAGARVSPDGDQIMVVNP